ncbi:DUF2306 domain-containing protein [Dinghuibacter silviterrae]|uniref:Putative membrane protein DUF2306 n=1 Tax=Dinghuibacter silviterrae TaxID=1539049 RepID=A0A4R8DP08_9BACT|nr:DUF2306 domain-containing protein [Dinghuibacter silviterrae]TDW99829.1 putative membrane protein DUF2306 [Dinghuibacter silviterrae]
MKTATYILATLLSYLAISMGTYLMIRMAIDYASFKTDIHFLKFKQDYIGIPLWRAAFYTHVFSAVLALGAGLTQFSEHVLKNHRRLHRTVGWFYVVTILVVNFPAAMVMAFYANGLLPSKIAFTILDCLWFWFTLKAVLAARDKRFKEHKQYMIRSYALTFSAITLRTWKIILGYVFHPDPLHLYMMDAWMGFVPNLLVAELLIQTKGLTLYTHVRNNQVRQHHKDHRKTADHGHDVPYAHIPVSGFGQRTAYPTGDGVGGPADQE